MTMKQMYPYEEHSAGIFRGRHKTGALSEAMLASDDILTLAKDILPEDTYLKADELSRMLVGSKSERNAARTALIRVLLPLPKRPVYYLAHELEFLPRWTREALRILGDFIDMLTKAAVYEKEGKRDIFRTSFGPAVKKFKTFYPQEKQLTEWLDRYNRFLYRDAKHDFRLPTGRTEHRFTSREVVLCVFVTKDLANRITALSATAARVRRDEPM